MLWYLLLILAVGVERLCELVVSTRNARWAFARGGVEFGQGHFPFMVFLHTALLLGCLVETFVGQREFIPLLGIPMLVLALASQVLRWWCVATLGRQWNTRVIVVPGAPLVDRGPYRLMRHPNYLAVVVEGFALPLVYTNWITATVFTIANAVLLVYFRIPTEERALDYATHKDRVFGRF